MSRNILNHEELPAFLKKLEARHPKHIAFINSQIRNYLIKKENTFLSKEEGHGVSLWFKSFNKNSLESKILKNNGINGNYYKLTLNEPYLEKYSHLKAKKLEGSQSPHSLN